MPVKAKCKKCNKREPTGEDGMCDSCRFVLILDSVLEEKTTTTNYSR